MLLVRRMLAAAAIAALPGLPAVSAAQQPPDSAVFRGRVLRRSDLAPIVGAEVAIPALDRHATTDSAGAFRLTGLPAGTQVARVRMVGYAMREDTVALAAGFEAVRTYALEPQAVKLDTVRTAAGPRYRSPMLREFEQRMRSHAGGYFIDGSVFRQHESGTLAGLIASRIPGVTFSNGKGAMGRVLVSTRKPCRGLALRSCGSTPDCFVAIYVDGTLYFNSRMAADGVQPPDLEHDLNPANFAAAEFYAGGASAPIGMHVDDDGCGSLWLWTRER